MTSKINKILKEIEQKKQELLNEYKNLKIKYNFEYIKGKIVFSEKAKEDYRKKKNSFLKSFLNLKFREIISGPFIYMMIIPTIILHIFIFIYQNTFFRFCNIPRVKIKDYVLLDRKSLDYLNWFEKLNCLYCSYVNGLFSYAVEIAGRTERYWCPIKYANKKMGGHSMEKEFADFGDSEGFRELYCKYENKK